MEALTGFGILVSAMFGIVSLIGIIKPMRKIGLPDRITALKVWIVSCAIFVVCIIAIPKESEEVSSKADSEVEKPVTISNRMATYEIKEALERSKKTKEQEAKNPKKDVDKPKPKETRSKNVIQKTVIPTVSASELYKEYVSNAVRANSKYLKKFVKVTGTVRIVTPDNQGDYAVGLGTEKKPLVVRANFKKSLEFQVKTINVGDDITVSCQVAGVGPDNNIHLYGAMLVEE